jgi:hypothetical protein
MTLKFNLFPSYQHHASEGGMLLLTKKGVTSSNIVGLVVGKAFSYPSFLDGRHPSHLSQEAN